MFIEPSSSAFAQGEQSAIAKIRKEAIFCPNCGSNSERHYIDKENIIITECSTCDYLMITSNVTTNLTVIEAYAPGINMSNLYQ